MNIFKKALLIALSAGLLSVPSTLDKVETVEAATNKTIYLHTGGSSLWNQGGAKMWAHIWNGSGSKDLNMTRVGNTDYYKVTFSSSYTDILFVRGNTSGNAGNWDNVWNQTTDLKLPTSSTQNTYKITGWGSGKSEGNWQSTLYKEYDLTLDYNDGVTTAKQSYNYFAENIETTVSFGTNPTREGYDFLGWSLDKNAELPTYTTTSTTYTATSDVTFYAVWKEAVANSCTVKYIVNDKVYTVAGAEIGTDVKDNVPTSSIAADNFKVVEWDVTGKLEGDVTVTATKYYSTFDEVKAELAFSYNFTSTLVVFQVKSSTAPTVTGYCSLTDETSEPITMDKEVTNSDGKTEFSALVDTKYDKLTFNWGANPWTVDRDYDKNAIWYNSATENGTWHYDGSTKATQRSSDFAINSVSDMKLRVGTLAMAADGFAGVETYGIRIAKGNTIADDNYYGPTWAAADVAKVDADGNADESGEYIRWNAVINNIPTDNYNDEFTAVAYVVIDGVSYDLCEARAVSVCSLASIYTSSLSGVSKYACQYIVDTYKA